MSEFKFGDRVPLIPETEIQTFFGSIKTPAWELPPLKIPKLDDRQKSAIKHGLGIDGADLVGKIPVASTVFGVAADTIRAMHEQALRGILSPEEYALFRKYDKQFLSSIAVLRTFIEVQPKV